MAKTTDPMEADLIAIAGRLRTAREWRGIGSRELGAAAGLSEAAVSSIEGGRVRRAEVRTLFRLADALRVRRAWLVAGDGLPEASK